MKDEINYKKMTKVQLIEIIRGQIVLTDHFRKKVDKYDTAECEAWENNKEIRFKLKMALESNEKLLQGLMLDANVNLQVDWGN